MAAERHLDQAVATFQGATSSMQRPSEHFRLLMRLRLLFMDSREKRCRYQYLPSQSPLVCPITPHGTGVYCIAHEPGVKDTELFDISLNEHISNHNYDFSGWIFPTDIDFSGRVFEHTVRFYKARFLSKADFTSCKFLKPVTFQESTFNDSVVFSFAIFSDLVGMRHVAFKGEAHFTQTVFCVGVDFFNSAFHSRTLFAATAFQGTSGFESADVARCEFLNIRPSPLVPGEQPPPNHPAALSMEHVRFMRARGLAQADFEGVEWATWLEPRRYFPDRRWRFVTRDELDARKLRRAESPEKDAPREMARATPEEAATVYRGLRRSYAQRVDHATAQEFYYREMEMRRYSLPPMKSNLLSVTALYWRLSRYGTSLSTALTWYVGLVLISAVLFSLGGFEVACPDRSLLCTGEYISWKPVESVSTAHVPNITRALLMSVDRAIRATLLQRDSDIFWITSFADIVEIVNWILGPLLLFQIGIAIRRLCERQF